MLNRTQAPITYSPVDFDYILPPCSEVVFDNGIKMYSYADHIQPVVQLELVFKAGLWVEQQTAVAQAVCGLMKSGTSNKTSFQINEFIEQYGASVKVGAGPDFASITLSCLTKHLSKLLPLILELITDTQFPQEELDIYVQNAKERLSVQLIKTDFIANRKIDEFVFGFSHPYGKYIGTEDYDKLSSDVLKDFLTSYYQSANCTLFMAGSFGQTELDQINALFGKSTWNKHAVLPNKEVKIFPDENKKHRITLDEKNVQGSIRLAQHFPSKQHPDFYPCILLNTLLGGYFGSRLMSNIREDKGYTYGIHSYLYNHIHDGAWLITTEVGKDVYEAAIVEIYAEMKLLREEQIEEEELLLVKNYVLGNLLGDLDGSFQIMQRWKNLILNNFTIDKFNANVNLYKTIQACTLQELANKYLIAENFYELVVC